MNVYDFDQTIYGGDSSVDFILFCCRKQPKLLAHLFRQARNVLKHAAGSIETTQLKAGVFSFLATASDVDELVRSFWAAHASKIRSWYLAQKEASDLVISASPEFLLEPICRTLGIAAPIATRMDPQSGKISGENCKGQEKVRRFREQYPGAAIQDFYSDSLTDTPLADMAKRAFLVKGKRWVPWPKEQ